MVKKKEKHSQRTGQKAEADSVKAAKAAVSPAMKAARAREVFRKRRKQYRHAKTLVRLAIRILNAAGR